MRQPFFIFHKIIHTAQTSRLKTAVPVCAGLVCVAAYMAGSETDLAGKIVGVWFPISAFVMIG